MLTASTTTPDLDDVLKRAGKLQKAVVSDLRRRIPQQVRKAVRHRYRKVRASEPDLRGRFDPRRTEIVYRGRRRTFDLSPDIRRPFAVPKRMRGEDGRWTSAFARRRYQSQKPWRVRLATGQVVAFGGDKRGLFVVPSKTGIPLLFRRSADEKIEIVKTISVPSMIRQAHVRKAILERVRSLTASRVQHHRRRFRL